MHVAKRALIVVGGPTASGKSAVAVKICKLVGGEVVSADSMQIYRGMDIGTAKPTTAEMEGVAHHMLDIVSPDAAFSAAEFRQMASECVEGICARGRVPVVCGGTGLYIDALTKPMRFSIEGDAAVRAALADDLARDGAQALWSRLLSIDPETARRLHVNDVRRVSRAIEVYRITGKPMSSFAEADRAREAPYAVDFYALHWPREALIQRIDDRVDAMMRAGFVGEVSRLVTANIKTARHALGYQEIASMLRGELSPEEAAAMIKIATRQYAKRQMTWLRRDPRVRWIDAQGKAVGEIAEEIVKLRREHATASN
jgi:tRNA dimethylallyltransferase